MSPTQTEDAEVGHGGGSENHEADLPPLYEEATKPPFDYFCDTTNSMTLGEEDDWPELQKSYSNADYGLPSYSEATGAPLPVSSLLLPGRKKHNIFIFRHINFPCTSLKIKQEDEKRSSLFIPKFLSAMVGKVAAIHTVKRFPLV